jgi:molybdopterin-guanine dinucleotide biosynthesis protein A
MPSADEPIGVVILAGGEASRLPGKLELDAGGVPLVVRVYLNVRSAGPVYVSAAGGFPAEIDAALECPIVLDRWPKRGPLAALYGILPHVREQRVFVVAADAPFVGAAMAEFLRGQWQAGIQAVVPLNPAGVLEPLCALYDRAALLEAAREVLAAGSGGVASAVERLHAKRVRVPNERVFANVNTAADRLLLQGRNTAS